jgi:hypothetical protein
MPVGRRASGFVLVALWRPTCRAQSIVSAAWS